MVVEHYLILFTKLHTLLKFKNPVSFCTYTLNRNQTRIGNTKISLGSSFVHILKRVMNCLSNHFGGRWGDKEKAIKIEEGFGGKKGDKQTRYSINIC